MGLNRVLQEEFIEGGMPNWGSHMSIMDGGSGAKIEGDPKLKPEALGCQTKR